MTDLIKWPVVNMIIDGQSIGVIPFVGTDPKGDSLLLGIGYHYADREGGDFWGPVVPHRLIQAWRAVIIFTGVHRIEHDTLRCCWYVSSEASRDFHESEAFLLKQQFDSSAAFDQLYGQAVSAVPTADEFDAMLFRI